MHLHRTSSVALALALTVGMASRARAVDCNGALNLGVSQGVNFEKVGDEATIKINLGSGTIAGGTHITLNRIRYELDCNHNFALGVPCTDQGDIMSYKGDASIVSGGSLAQCQVTWTSNLPAGGSSPNEIVFTPSTPIVLPPNQSSDPALDLCSFTFKVKLDHLESSDPADPNFDGDPTTVEVVAGFSTRTPADAPCDNGGSSGVTQSGAVTICPARKTVTNGGEPAGSS